MDDDAQPEPDLIQDGLRRARHNEAVQNLRWLIGSFEVAAWAAVLLLALILWRVW